MLFKNVLTYSSFHFVSQFITFIAHFILRRILVPELMGIWNMVQVIISYTQNISLGILNGAFRKLPLLSGQDSTQKSFQIRSVTLSFGLIEVSVICLAILGYCYWVSDQKSDLEIWALVTAALLLIPLRIKDSFVIFFQGNQNYVDLSTASLLGNIVYAISVPIGAFYYGVKGLLAMVLLAEIFRATYLVFKGLQKKLKTRLGWNSFELKKLISFGFTNKIADYPNIFFMQLDLLWITKLMDLKTLGLYALAKSFASQSSDIATRMGNVLYTRTLAQIGEGIKRSKIALDMGRFVQFQMLFTFPLIFWGVVNIAPLLIRQIIPNYVEAIPVLPIILMLGFFISQNNNLFSLWIAEKKMLAFGTSNLFGVFTIGSALGMSYFIWQQQTITSIASSMIVGLLGYFLYMCLTAGKEIWGLKKSLFIFIQVLSSALWTATIFNWVFKPHTQLLAFSTDLSLTLVTMAKSFLLIAPVLIYGLWISDAAKMIYKKFLSK